MSMVCECVGEFSPIFSSLANGSKRMIGRKQNLNNIINRLVYSHNGNKQQTQKQSG